MPTRTNERAVERARELFNPEAAALVGPRPGSERGYLDLIEGELESTGVAQNLMLTRFVPAIYERWWRPALARAVKGPAGPGMPGELEIARLMLALTSGETVLDLACGPGNFTRKLARLVAPEGLAVGVDASATMLARGAAELERRGPANVALVRADATALPFRDRSFDAVCCFAALHLFAKPFSALDEMRRVLAPGGRIALMTSVRRQVTLERLKPLIERASGMRIFEAEEVTEALRVRGFDAIEQRVSGMVQFVGGRLAARDVS